MNGIMRWYNTNKKKFFTTIIVVVFVLILIRTLNSLAEQNLKNKQNLAKNNIANQNSITNSISMGKSESVVSGEKLPTEHTNLIKKLDEFVSYCSNGEIDKAYALLSDECKEEMYPSQEFFKSGYYDVIFDGKKKDISAENWIGNIYKVKFVEDALATGSYNSTTARQDYITIVKDKDGLLKLNINGYIGRENPNTLSKVDGIEIKVTETNIYMDYQTVTYEITNNTDKKIMLTEPNIVDTMYLEDSNKIKYKAYEHELLKSDLKFIPGEKKSLTIKYYSRYVSSKEITSAVFNRIIANYEIYEQIENKAYYRDYTAIKIEL